MGARDSAALVKPDSVGAGSVAGAAVTVTGAGGEVAEMGRRGVTP